MLFLLQCISFETIYCYPLWKNQVILQIIIILLVKGNFVYEKKLKKIPVTLAVMLNISVNFSVKINKIKIKEHWNKIDYSSPSFGKQLSIGMHTEGLFTDEVLDGAGLLSECA